MGFVQGLPRRMRLTHSGSVASNSSVASLLVGIELCPFKLLSVGHQFYSLGVF
jgi:hypothetical protein